MIRTVKRISYSILAINMLLALPSIALLALLNSPQELLNYILLDSWYAPFTVLTTGLFSIAVIMSMSSFIMSFVSLIALLLLYTFMLNKLGNYVCIKFKSLIYNIKSYLDRFRAIEWLLRYIGVSSIVSSCYCIILILDLALSALGIPTFTITNFILPSPYLNSIPLNLVCNPEMITLVGTPISVAIIFVVMYQIICLVSYFIVYKNNLLKSIQGPLLAYAIYALLILTNLYIF